MAQDILIKTTDLEKTYILGRTNKVRALRGINLQFEEGAITALIGPSGSGKSTLLNILGGLDRDYEGNVLVDGTDLQKINPNTYRREWCQTVFQQFYLVPALSVYENMTLPIVFGKQVQGKALKNRAMSILEQVGLVDRKDHKPRELSGGQIQRVAIARALITQPRIIFADEPTGNLDTKTGDEIMTLLKKINQEFGTTIVIITHDQEVIKDVPQQIHLRDGKVEKVLG